MKKAVSLIVLAVMLTLCLASCGQSGVTLEQVKNNGKLVIGTSPDFPPFESLEGDKIVGIEVEIVDLICKELGVTAQYEQIDFESVLTGVSSGKFDMGMSGITITPKRQKNALFTNPYFLAAQSIVVPEGSSIKSKADLAGKKVSVQTGTTADIFCTENGYTVSRFAQNGDAQDALNTGKVDAWVIDNLTAIDMVASYNEDAEVKLVILDEEVTTEPYAFAFAFGSETLVEEINKIIKKLVDDGTIPAIFERYGVEYIAPSAE